MATDSCDSRPGRRPLPRIALLTDGMYPYVMGGMQRHSRLLAENLARAGVELTVFHTALTPETIEQARVGADRPAEPWGRIDARLVDYPRPGRYPGHYIRDSWRYSAALLNVYLANPPQADFIYAQGLTGLAFVQARRRGGLLPPVGINAHGYPMFQKPAGLRGRMDQLLLAPTFRRLSLDADFVFTFGGRVRDIVTGVLRVPAERILEVPNAVDDSWIVPIPSPCATRRRFLFVGRYDRVKGLAELHHAIASGRLDMADFHFVGPIPERLRLRLPSCIYLGTIGDTARLQACFDDADVLVCPSHAEGMPTVILEALARGLAVIATDVGAVNTLVDSTNGILLAGPDPVAISESIRWLCALPDAVIGAMKHASLARAARYGWRQVTACTISTIACAINATAARARPDLAATKTPSRG